MPTDLPKMRETDELPNCNKECSTAKIEEAGKQLIAALEQACTNKALLNNIGVMFRKANGYYDTDTSIT